MAGRVLDEPARRERESHRPVVVSVAVVVESVDAGTRLAQANVSQLVEKAGVIGERE